MIKKITPQNFKKYGWVIEYPKKNLKSRKVNLFRIVLKEKHLVIITVLKKSQDFEKLVTLIKNHFKITDELDEPKDIILISNNL